MNLRIFHSYGLYSKKKLQGFKRPSRHFSFLNFDLDFDEN